MKKCIEFSIRSDCFAPDLNIDDVSREMLNDQKKKEAESKKDDDIRNEEGG